MKNRNYLMIVALVSGLFLSVSCEKEDDSMEQDETPSEMTIAGIASSNDDFSILVEALVKADLVNTLNGEGNFTVFAPDNNAFMNLFDALDVNGIEDLSAEALKPILLYHVLGESMPSTMITDGYYSSLSPSQGSTVSMYISTGDGVSINSAASVTSADIQASNGYIHAIDAVILPPTAVDIAINNSNFSYLVEAVVKAGLVEILSAPGPYTIFAPTNEAFEQLFAELGVSGIEDIPAESLIPILQYHVVSGNILSSDLIEGPVATLNGDVVFKLADSVTINDSSEVIATDIQGTNGVIHVIDQVLIP
jgi:transforming growth factor-beta-induced protein